MKKNKKMKPKQLLRMLLDEAMQDAPRSTPECCHFGECGGCEFQDIDYPSQAKAKREVLIELIARHGLSAEFTLPAIELVASPRPLGYRQRMDYVYAFTKAGLRKRNSHKWVIELTECPLLGTAGFTAFRRARELASEYNLISYNYLSHQGFLRYFVVRKTRPGEILLSLVTKSREYEAEITAIAEKLLAEKLVTSVHWLLQESLSDVSFGESIRHWGHEYIRETYMGKDFFIGPNTFFQANADVAEIAYSRIREQVRTTSPKLVIDTYSGTGVIAQLITEAADEIIAVENVPDNLVIAQENLKNNGITNVSLIEADALKYLSQFQRAPEHIVLNPPRAGLGEKACNQVKRINPAVISYMSCNPLTLLQDLTVLTTQYHITECTVFDMFPQTKHFECLVLLKRR